MSILPRYFDNTRISAFRSCPRKFYFRHVRHWRNQGVSAPLVFGSSWHEAMDIVWQLAKSPASDSDILAEAMKAFWAKWEAEGAPSKASWSLETEERFGARTPNNAAEILSEYIQQRRKWIQSIELLAVEKPFAVLLDPKDTSTIYVGRRDKDFKFEGRIYTGEHKTTTSYKKDGGFKNDFIESFSPNSQVDGYIHAGHMDYGSDYKGVWIDACLVHKKERHFKFIPVSRMTEMLDGWLSDTKYWIAQIYQNYAILAIGQEEKKNLPGMKVTYMKAFPKNTDRCHDYNSACPYMSMCKAWNNPERYSEPPEGMIVDKWEPFKELELGQIGLKPEDSTNAN